LFGSGQGYKNEASASLMKQMLHFCNMPINLIIFTLSLRFIRQTKDVLHLSRAAESDTTNNNLLFQAVMNWLDQAQCML
jgi:hypothetical protein